MVPYITLNCACFIEPYICLQFANRFGFSLPDKACGSRYMGTITGISDLDPVRWPNSHWRSVKVNSGICCNTFTPTVLDY